MRPWGMIGVGAIGIKILIKEEVDLLCMIDNAFTQGFDHIREGSPPEDFGETKVSGTCLNFAVADGHGNSNCTRSRIDSKTACHVAIKVFESFAKGVTEHAMESMLLGIEADIRKVI